MTTTFLIVLFSGCVLLVFYTYVLFPWIVHIAAAGKSINNDVFISDLDFPGVSVILSAFNEEKVIGEKLKGLLQSDYPPGKLEIIVGSDCSSDNTNFIVSAIAAGDERIRFFPFEKRRGKPSVVNDLADKAKFQVLILTDANVMFEKDTIRKLTRHFKVENIGLVGANILNVGMKKDGISVQEKSYIERENLIKYNEGVAWGTMMGPFGGCYALRKNLYAHVPANFLVDDFFISMKVLEKKFQCINELQAVCYEDVSNDIRQEYRRKARISAGNFQNLVAFGHFLLRPFSATGYCFLSHKVLRWLTPFLILISLLSLFGLSETFTWAFLLLCGEILLLLSPIFDSILIRFGVHLKLLRFVAYFSLMNLALLKGFLRFLSGVNSSVWTPTKRN